MGRKALELLRYIIDSRGSCKISIPETPFCWTTLLLAIEREGSADLLVIQGNPELEETLSLSGKGEVLVEYADENGVLCHFMVAQIRTSLEKIWVKFPPVIYRVQRRMFFRIKAQEGSEIVFPAEPGREVRGIIRDYSLGGVAFWTHEPLLLKTGDLVEDLCLRIPEKGGWFEIPIYGALVRRVQTGILEDKPLYALEFLGMSRRTRRLLSSHILGRKRMIMRKFKIPPFLLGSPRSLQIGIPATPSAAAVRQGTHIMPSSS